MCSVAGVSYANCAGDVMFHPPDALWPYFILLSCPGNSAYWLRVWERARDRHLHLHLSCVSSAGDGRGDAEGQGVEDNANNMRWGLIQSELEMQWMESGSFTTEAEVCEWGAALCGGFRGPPRAGVPTATAFCKKHTHLQLLDTLEW